MACFKELPAQFGKIPARNPSQPLLFFPVPVVSPAPLVATGIGSSLHSITVSDLKGQGSEAKDGERLGYKRAAAPPPPDPWLRSRSGSRAGSWAPGTSASLRAQSRLGASCPSPCRLVPVPGTPCSLLPLLISRTLP